MSKTKLPLSVFEDPPRKHVLLLSCMDTRLLDNVVQFMDELNLQNRYDHLIFAGAAMGARSLYSPITKPRAEGLAWKDVFFDHLVAAIDLLHRDIKDIFLLEHLDCGAYKELHLDPKVRKKYKKESDVANLAQFHAYEACAFAEDIEDFCRAQRKQPGKEETWKDIRVRCLLMDLRGDVLDIFCETSSRSQRAKKK